MSGSPEENRTGFRIAALLVMSVLTAAGAAVVRPVSGWGWNRPAVQEITSAEAVRWDGVLWVDARSRELYAHGHLRGAVLLNEEDWNSLLASFASAWKPGTRIIVYCDPGSCDASRSVALRLKSELPGAELWVLTGDWRRIP